MSGFPPWGSEGTSDDDSDRDWPKPEGPSEWDLFRKESEPEAVLSDGAIDAIARGEPVDSVLVTIGDNTLSVQASPALWSHIFTAVARKARSCADCRELMSVFERVISHLKEREE